MPDQLLKQIVYTIRLKEQCPYQSMVPRIVLKIGSKEAYINGKKTTAPVAPVKIKYVNENVTKILVPSDLYLRIWDMNIHGTKYMYCICK